MIFYPGYGSQPFFRHMLVAGRKSGFILSSPEKGRSEEEFV